MTVGIYKKTARDIMTRDLVTVRNNETIHDALLLMAENRVAALPVIDKVGACVGIITQSDIVALARDVEVEDENPGPTDFGPFFLANDRLESITHERIDDVMSDRIVQALPDDLVTTIADKMLQKEIHHVPICEENGALIGMISTMDILSALRAPVAT